MFIANVNVFTRLRDFIIKFYSLRDGNRHEISRQNYEQNCEMCVALAGRPDVHRDEIREHVRTVSFFWYFSGEGLVSLTGLELCQEQITCVRAIAL